ncbi:MAG: pseudaminic acid synthase [Lachnospiraceae bacterium]|nr:pseudaminic acid synthase [Lachnospiraceae bacterium]
MKNEIKIGSRLIGPGSKTMVVAELSANHNGDYQRALEIVHAASEAGADAIKLQTYTADTITIDCDSPLFQINQGTIWDGTTLYKLYQEAYTPWEWQPKLKEEAEKLGMECFSSPFDLTSVDFLEEMNVPAYKIASYEINDIPMIKKIAKLHKPVIFATGIAYPEDIKLALDTCRAEGNDQIILLKCVSSYPTPYSMVNLKLIPKLSEDYNCITGLSDHTMGSTVAVGAVALGARMIEKHLTLKRSDGGPDSAFSMEPSEFAQMVKEIRIMEEAVGSDKYELTEKQKIEHGRSRSLFITKDVKKGDIITADNVRSIRPGQGLHTKYYENILGKQFNADLKKGTPMSLDHIAD